MCCRETKERIDLERRAVQRGSTRTNIMLAWIPFLEPMNAMQSVWYIFIIPMAFGIAVVYRAMREDTYT